MNNYKEFFYAIVIFFSISFGASGVAKASSTDIIIDGSERGQFISVPGNYFLDPTSLLNANQAWLQRLSFSQSGKTNGWIAPQSGSVWSYYSLVNNTDSEITVYLEYPVQQSITLSLYEKLGTENQFVRKTVTPYDSSHREIPLPRMALPISLQANERKHVLLESYSDVSTARFTSFRIWTSAALVKATVNEHVTFASVMTFIILSAIAAFICFKFLKEAFFKWYIILALASIPVIGLQSGVLNIYIPGLDYHPLGTIAVALMVASCVQFIRIYANASYHSLHLDRVYKTTIIVSLSCVPVAIVGFHELAMQLQQLTLFAFAIAIFAAIYSAYKGEKQMSIMILTMILCLEVIVCNSALIWGWLPASYEFMFFPTVGTVAPLTCIMIAMSRKAIVHMKEGSTENTFEKVYAFEKQVKQQNLILKKAKEQAEFEARTDMLTQLPNRRAFMALAKMSVAQAKRDSKPLSFIAFDIDNFKQINDNYGHPAGDKTLQEVGAIIRSVIRDSDFCGRVGGEEFMIGCHNSSIDNAYKLAERIRREIESCVINYEGLEFSTTVSIGLSQLDENDDLDSVVKKSDEAMYRSKTTGKNKATYYAA
ncbi:diguanylate cyclase [Thalassotalea ponticola]|uniref:sensor domain-containing diguanylate cyclase n=1 Tax=Thalassotalea ponticola TaxID=1523392 RepID=UPI0025B304B7|nr:diguanylate cyclase [Thalassotalea ponticola]MDN3652935.1 diguanylate cyclase [Thalassotalea ponticola]